jgi:hypothetical protein
VGPWLTGPVQVQRLANTLKLTNRIEGTLALQDVALFDGAAEPVSLRIDEELAAGASRDVATAEIFSDAAVSFAAAGGTRPSFEEVRATIEEIQCNVVFVDLVNYENHGLTRLDIEARLRGVPGISAVPMAERRGSVSFLLPLTTYLATRTVEFRVHKTFGDQPRATTDWVAWDMEAQSNVVSLTWDLMAP